MLFPRAYSLYQNRLLTFFQNLFNPLYEAEFKHLTKILPASNKPKIVIDIGGNAGQSSIALDRIFDIDELHIFEPNIKIAELCRRLKLKKVVNKYVYDIALADKTTEKLLHTPIYKGVTFWGLASLDENQSYKLLNSNSIWNFKPGLLKSLQTLVTIKTLDSLNLSPDFIKIDTEGAEFKIIQGAMKTIQRCRPALYIECSGTRDEIFNKLKPLGYSNFELIENVWRISIGKSLIQVFIP